MQSGSSSQNISGRKKLGLAARKAGSEESCGLQMYSSRYLLIMFFSFIFFFFSSARIFRDALLLPGGRVRTEGRKKSDRWIIKGLDLTF